MSFRRAHIAGAGLSGLSAAVSLARAGLSVRLCDSAAQAGGRCRSYHDPQLGAVIDNGNHLVLSGNRAVMDYLRTIGASGGLVGPDHADFAFADVRSGERWRVRINDGRLPWWIFAPSRRVPGTRASDYLALAGLMRGEDRAIGQRVATDGALWTRLLEPVLVAALNTAPVEASARLAAAVMRETLGQGGRAARPRIAHPTLGGCFIDPALAWLKVKRASVHLGRRLRAIGFDGDRVSGLDWGEGMEAVHGDEAVILAVPPWVASALVPGLVVPDEFRAIVNAHFACSPPEGAAPMVGIIGGTAEWIFAFPDRISITVSAADALVDRDREELARLFWKDVAAVHGLSGDMPRWQVVKEKRATFAATPQQDAKRPGTATRWRNLFLAGDWTATGLPATIEGALRSGEKAAAMVLG